MGTPEDLAARREALLAAVRHVRTPEGANHFSQPIGAVITEDPGKRAAKAVRADIPEFVFDMPNSSKDAPISPSTGLPIYLYRAVSEEDWQQIITNGYIQSDGRMNLGADEGTVAADRNPDWYLPNSLGSRGRILRLTVTPSDGWWRDHDSYWKTPKPIPLDRVDAITPLSLNGTRDPARVTPRHVLVDLDNQFNNAFIKAFPNWDGRGLLRDVKDQIYAMSRTVPREGATTEEVRDYLQRVEDMLDVLKPDEYSDETPEQIRNAVESVIYGARTTLDIMDTLPKAVLTAAAADATALIVAAIPADDDPIWSVSSEPKPHMTMLYFGKDVDPETTEALRYAIADGVAEYLAAGDGAVTAPVKGREALGDDEADVLMLDPGSLWSLREHLLLKPVIRAAYDAVEQYPTWTPHTTLGYPEAPATGEPGTEIRFDRIALWDDDYAGEEFSLTDSAVTADATSNQWQHRDQHGRWLEMSPEAKRLGAGGSLPKAPQIVGDRTDRVRVPAMLSAEAPLQMTRLSAGEYITADGEHVLSLVEGTTWRILMAKIRQRLAGTIDYPSYEDARTALAALLREGPSGLRAANQRITTAQKREALLAAVRHVRTPEGAARYDQPIGSIITADRGVKATLPSTTVKWRDLTVGDRFLDAMGRISEVISLQPWGDAEGEAFRQYAATHDDVTNVSDLNWDAELAAKAKAEWESKGRKVVLLSVDGPNAGHWNYSDGVSNPEYEFTRAPSIGDPFEAEIVAPARAAMRALAEKYPDGVDQALGRALHSAPPEPGLSEEFKRLLALPEVQKWRQRDLPNARTRLADLETEGERLSGMGGQATAVVKNWDAQLEARREFLALLPKGAQPPWRWANEDEVGTLGGVFAEVTRLEEAHQDEYAAWLEQKRNITPTSPEALQILADVEAVGAIVREGIKRGIVRAEAEQVYPQTGVEYKSTREGARRHLSRRAVAALRGHAETTSQKWLTDFDMTKLGALRGLREDEKQVLTESLLFFPKDWVSGFDRLGQVTTDKSTRGYFGTEGTRRRQHHISLSTPHNLDDLGEMQTTAVHEVGHGMERVIPGLTALEMIFWHQRVGHGSATLLEAFDSAEMPRKVVFRTNREYTLKYYGKTVKGRSSDKAEQKMYTSPDMTTMPESWEVFTTGVQEVLGDGFTDYTVRNDRYSGDQQDTELWDLTMGALLSLPGTPGYGINLPPDGTMRAEEVQLTMAPKMITDQELITAAHPSTRGKRQYRALYSKGGDVTFAVDSAETAQRYAREYGMRFLGGQAPVSVRWSRDPMEPETYTMSAPVTAEPLQHPTRRGFLTIDTERLDALLAQDFATQTEAQTAIRTAVWGDVPLRERLPLLPVEKYGRYGIEVTVMVRGKPVVVRFDNYGRKG